MSEPELVTPDRTPVNGLRQTRILLPSTREAWAWYAGADDG